MKYLTDKDAATLRAQVEAQAAKPRKIFAIANDILEYWPKPYYGAIPYIKAMRDLTTINDTYGEDSARRIVNYFLSNANTFRGEDARRLKAELNALLKQ